MILLNGLKYALKQYNMFYDVLCITLTPMHITMHHYASLKCITQMHHSDASLRYRKHRLYITRPEGSGEPFGELPFSFPNVREDGDEGDWSYREYQE